MRYSWFLALSGCLVSVSADSPGGGYDIASLRIEPAGGSAQEAPDAGRFEFGTLGNLDGDDAFACPDTGLPCGDAVSILAYHWIGHLAPLWAPERVLFQLPEWDGPAERWLGPIPVGNLTCELHRESKHPTVLAGDCTGPEEGPLSITLTLDR